MRKNVRYWRKKDLFTAVRAMDEVSVLRALDVGADIESRDARGASPLLLAIEMRSLEIVRALLDRGADVLAVDVHGWSAIQVAVGSATNRIGSDEILEMIAFLKSRGGDVNIKNAVGGTALHTAAGDGQARLCRVLLDLGADLNAMDNQGRTPLNLACTPSCFLAAGCVLISYGANKRGCAVSDGSAFANILAMNQLQAAVSANLPDMVVKLLDAGMDPSARGRLDQSPIEIAKTLDLLHISEIINAHAARKLAVSIINEIDSGSRQHFIRKAPQLI